MPEKHTEPKISMTELCVQTAENNRTLRGLYVAARELDEWKGELAFKNLPDSITGAMSPSTFTRWTKPDSDKLLPPKAHADLVSMLARLGILDQRVKLRDSFKSITPNYLFHAISLSLNIQLHTLNNIANRATGIYRLWRPALHWQGHFVLGMIKVWEDSNDFSVHTSELNRFKGQDRSIPAETVTDGYMLCKNGKHFILSRDGGQRGLGLTLFDSTFHDKNKQIVGMLGVTIGTYGKDILATRVYIERWTDSEQKLIEQLDLVEQEDVPGSILQKLSRIEASPFDVRF